MILKKFVYKNVNSRNDLAINIIKNSKKKLTLDEDTLKNEIDRLLNYVVLIL